MSGVILPVAGAIGGFILGGPAGAIMGANLGSAAGNIFASSKTQHVNLPAQEGARISDLRVQISSYGEVIPKVYGSMRLAGNIIWGANIREVENRTTHEQRHTSRGKGGGRKRTTVTSQTVVTYSYYSTLAVAICEGEVTEVSRIWADTMLITEDLLGGKQGKFNIHLGTEDQLPDDIIARHKGFGTYPAYRGLCYVVFEDFPLERFGNRIPNFSFEVKRSVKTKPAVEDKVKDIILIPGAGEFVYSDQIYKKQEGYDRDGFIPTETRYVNMHNYSAKADVLLALDQMEKSLPNIEWVALVVTWFATSTNAGSCRIVPKIEFSNKGSRILPRDWQVAGIPRSAAEEVLDFFRPSDPLIQSLHFFNYIPTYGGTPDDNSIVALCQELKRRGYRIMLYPMIFVDEIEPSPKPWRGRIKAGSGQDVVSWFRKRDGYNRFIMHYANLVGSQVDAIIIGSELVGLTSFTDGAGSYPAVGELVNLAAMVKNRLGNNCLVTYAADWSEYHHAEGGWFNLDPLWASDNIDFIGIDSYFPLTPDLPQRSITEEVIKSAWESGEGWDYYWMNDRTLKVNFAEDSPDDPNKYAWKNLEHWWTTNHYNPDGSVTSWRPKMKPVWFTEFGFPSVDGCANQPNVFYDPSSSESFFPRSSKGRVNFLAQRQALNATLDYLEERCRKPGLNNLVPRRFVWTYDARPFPFWPDFRNIWRDGNLWATGHWVNGKLGISSLGGIVAEILNMTGLDPSDYDVSRLSSEVQGYVINEHITAREAIQKLQNAYFFDVVESDGVLKFVPRTSQVDDAQVPVITEDDLVPNSSGDMLETMEIVISQEIELPQKVTITHINQLQNYDLLTAESQRQVTSTKEQINITLPIVLSSSEASSIADVTLYNAWQERINYQLTLPPKYSYLEPTDIIKVVSQGVISQMRITRTDSQRSGAVRITATSFDLSMYDFYRDTNYLLPSYEGPEVPADVTIDFIEAPLLPFEDSHTDGTLWIGIIAGDNNWNGSQIYKSPLEVEDYKLFASCILESSLGVVHNILGPSSPFVFDRTSEIIVQLFSRKCLESVSELAVLNGENIALIGDELIQFKTAELIGEKQYRLRTLLRGRQGTEWAIGSHKEGERFCLLDGSLNSNDVNSDFIGRGAYYKVITANQSLDEVQPVTFAYKGKKLKPLSPVYLTKTTDEAGNITISWIRRSRIGNAWRDHVDAPLGEDKECYHIEITIDDKIIRLIESDTQSCIYSREQQIEDFAENWPDKIIATIYQISGIVGRGYGSSINL